MVAQKNHTKYYVKYTLTVYLLIICALHIQAQERQDATKLRTVVIDAGHGGKDPGTVGKNVFEKNIVLPVALKLGAYIKERHPDVNVVYTRDKDVFLEVWERADIANKHKADLFISIHVNSTNNKAASVNGSETYVMGLNKSGANMEVSKRENAVITLEDDYTTKYEGYDPKSPESFIIFSLVQNAHLEQSLALASLIQEELPKTGVKNNRGVKQDVFLVLWRTVMPSVLVELGFISNANDEKYLMSAKGQDEIARSLAKAFDNYKEHYERNTVAYVDETREKYIIRDSKPVTPPKTTPPTSAKTENVTKPQTTTVAQGEDAKDVRYYRVQIMATPKRISLNDPKMEKYGEVREMVENKLYKITVGNFTSLQEASAFCKEVRKSYPDAFVVCFLNDKKVPLK